ncbi:MAG TPA: hypothetical protein DDZ34_04795 [Syntrophaceae bacterium]|nr:hypothetical protein [Syntrophaceae bacterium]
MKWISSPSFPAFSPAQDWAPAPAKRYAELKPVLELSVATPTRPPGETSARVAKDGVMSIIRRRRYSSILDHDAHVIWDAWARSGQALSILAADGIHHLGHQIPRIRKGQPTCHKVQGYPQRSLLHDIA